MVFIIPEKKFSKKKIAKKLIAPKDYAIINGTNDGDTCLANFSNVSDIPSFCPPQRFYKLDEDKQSQTLGFVTEEQIKDGIYAWLHDDTFTRAVLVIFRNFVNYDGDYNIFVCLRKPVYKKYTIQIGIRMLEIMGLKDAKFQCVFTWDELETDPSLLERNMKNKDIDLLRDNLEYVEDIFRKKDKKF